MTMVVSAKNGSIVAVTGSGIRHMSDSLIAFQPAIDEPSNMVPSAKISSSIMLMSKVTCCHLPRGSVKRRSTYFTSLSLIDFRTSLAVFMNTPFGYYGSVSRTLEPCRSHLLQNLGSSLFILARVLDTNRSLNPLENA